MRKEPKAAALTRHRPYSQIAPVIGIVVCFVTFAHMASKPSVGVKKAGEAFSKERLARDWKEISFMKYGNMVRLDLQQGRVVGSVSGRPVWVQWIRSAQSPIRSSASVRNPLRLLCSHFRSRSKRTCFHSLAFDLTTARHASCVSWRPTTESTALTTSSGRASTAELR